jgi:hypothetical protein
MKSHEESTGNLQIFIASQIYLPGEFKETEKRNCRELYYDPLTKIITGKGDYSSDELLFKLTAKALL